MVNSNKSKLTLLTEMARDIEMFPGKVDGFLDTFNQRKSKIDKSKLFVLMDSYVKLQGRYEELYFKIESDKTLT